MRRRVAVGVVLLAVLIAACNQTKQAPKPQTSKSPKSPVPVAAVPAEARVEGTFTNAPHESSFTFNPNCATGPCDVRALGEKLSLIYAGNKSGKKVSQFVRIGPKGDVTPKATLSQNGAAYTGTGHLRAVCGHPDLVVPVTVVYRFEITKAETIDGVVRATELRWSTTERGKKGKTVEHLAFGTTLTTTCKPPVFKNDGVATLEA